MLKYTYNRWSGSISVPVVCVNDNCRDDILRIPGVTVIKVFEKKLRNVKYGYLMVFVTLLLQGCVSTAVGVAVGTTVAVGKTAVKVPVKATGAAVGAITGSRDEEEEADDPAQKD